MNGPGDLTVTQNSNTPDPKNCSLVSIIPIIGMSSCRGRAEAFARRLSSKLRTLGTQADDADGFHEDDPIINGGNINTWVTDSNGGEQTVTDLQPLRQESDSFFDFDCELDSPGSPVDECEYLRLIESASNTPHNSVAESGYVCASNSSSHSSSDGPYFDVSSETEPCTSHLLDHQCQLEETSCSHHICLPRHHLASNEEENSSLTLKPLDQRNGYQRNKDVKETMPIEGPDIDIGESATSELCHMENPKTNDIQHTQENISQEFQNLSQDFKDEQQDSYDSNFPEKHNEMAETMHGEVLLEMSQESKQTIHILNGHAEDGDDILKAEVNEEIEEQKPKYKISSHEISKQQTENNKTSHMHMDTTDDEDDCRPQRVRRCSSLKTGKTPPGTPGRKKIVRFADVLGLDLADIKTFLDEIPTIPKSAYEDLEILETESPIQLGPKSDKLLMPLFQQPGGFSNFLDIVREKLVSLENAAVTDGINQTITGSVRVRNLDFHKSVHIRYSLDGWRSFADLQANYVENSCDGFSDKFSFVLFGNSLHIGQRLEFAVRFQCKGQQYWDNNYGSNYCFQCLPTSAPVISSIATILPTHHTNSMIALLSPTVGETWCTSFY